MNYKHLLVGAFFIIGLAFHDVASSSDKVPAVLNDLPPANRLPLNLETFCSGFPNAFAITNQNFTEEASSLCVNGSPTSVLQEIFGNPYLGGNRPDRNIVNIRGRRDGVNGQNIRINIAYAMRIPKSAVATLLGEEGHVETPYANNILRINAEFAETPLNLGDADTAFSIVQQTNVDNGRGGGNNVVFQDTSMHELKMYRMQPNNFDYFLAIRTLVEPSEQFSYSVVLRGVMSDPESPKDSAYVFTVLNFIMNSRGDPNGNIGDGMNDTFREFIADDMRALYNSHVNED